MTTWLDWFFLLHNGSESLNDSIIFYHINHRKILFYTKGGQTTHWAIWKRNKIMSKKKVEELLRAARTHSVNPLSYIFHFIFPFRSFLSNNLNIFSTSKFSWSINQLCVRVYGVHDEIEHRVYTLLDVVVLYGIYLSEMAYADYWFSVDFSFFSL